MMSALVSPDANRFPDTFPRTFRLTFAPRGPHRCQDKYLFPELFDGEAGAMTVKREIRRGAIFACAVLAALFIGKLATGDEAASPQGNAWLSDSSGSFSMSRKNYASQKQAGGGIAAVDAQKYEKVATVGESTSDFDADRAKVESLIASSGALTQYEQQQGLSGHRTLQLGIGVPPSQFDSFVEEVPQDREAHLSGHRQDRQDQRIPAIARQERNAGEIPEDFDRYGGFGRLG